MGMPEIPPQHHRPDLYHTIIDLLESIALEETALSHLLNAEAEKNSAFYLSCIIMYPVRCFNRL